MRLSSPAAHLTYCTNIHPAESWAETLKAVQCHVPAVRAAIGAPDPFAVGLRLSARAARELRQGDALRRFADWLHEQGLYVPTINGFPYGTFHRTPVKAEVYRPDWSQPERADYTRDLIAVLESLVPDHATPGSISTVPVCFGPEATPERVAGAALNLIEIAAEIFSRCRAGATPIVLALEPEPFCRLETIEQTIAFFEEHLFSVQAREQFVRRTGASASQAEAGLRRHLGVCFDACHAAVQFEDPVQAWRSLRQAGIEVGKVQLTSALELSAVTVQDVGAVRAFADDVYLHQVVVSSRKSGRILRRYVDLHEAVDAFDPGQAGEIDWRIHFHIPVFESHPGRFSSTQPFLRDLLAAIATPADSSANLHLEVETYTFDVLPHALRAVEVNEAIARELRWVLDRWQELGGST